MTIIDTTGDGTITDKFGTEPAVWKGISSEEDYAPAHVALGTFNFGDSGSPPANLHYVGTAPDYTSIETDLLISLGADFNADEKVDGSDYNILNENWDGGSGPADKDWPHGDCTDIAYNRAGDGHVDGFDALVLSANWTGSPTWEGSAEAVYNARTGRLAVSVENVFSWMIISDGLMTGPDDVGDVLPLGTGGLVTNTIDAVGETSAYDPEAGGDLLFTPMTYKANLGRIAAEDRDASEFTLIYSVYLGQGPIFAEVGSIGGGMSEAQAADYYFAQLAQDDTEGTDQEDEISPELQAWLLGAA